MFGKVLGVSIFIFAKCVGLVRKKWCQQTLVTGALGKISQRMLVWIGPFQ